MTDNFEKILDPCGRYLATNNKTATYFHANDNLREIIYVHIYIQTYHPTDFRRSDEQNT